MKKKIVWVISIIFIILCIIVITKGMNIIQDAAVYEYDENGNEIYSCLGKGSNKVYSKYNENNKIIEQKNEFGSGSNKNEVIINYEYEDNLCIKKISKSSGFPSSEDYEIKYEYNEMGLRTKEIDSIKGTTLFEYDDNSKLIKKIAPDNTFINYGYDENGKCIYEESSDGGLIKFEYDNKGRSLKTTYVNHKNYGNTTLVWEYFDEDPEISCKFYTITDFSTSWLLYDKNNEYIETGWECGDLILKTIYKKVVKYKYWKNGNLRSKKIYIIHQKEVKQ